MSWIKILKFNLLTIISLLLILEVTLSFAFLVREKVSVNNEVESTLKPNWTNDVLGFKNKTKNFRGYPYKAFLGWVSPDVQGQYLNITDGQRHTVLAKSIENEETLHFFGGSTMWGHSVSDKNTIPSLVSENLKINSVNYGEQAYNSRQELNLLLDKLETIKANDVVIFYDGVNDAYHNCRSHNSPNGNAREFFIKQKLSSNYPDRVNLLESLSIYRFIRGFSNKISNSNSNSNKDKGYTNECSNIDYANKVANFLVNNWKAVDAILLEKNVKFICGLQPNPYTFDGNIEYSLVEFNDQIDSVYPLIIEKAKGMSCFVDYSKVMTQDNYVDDCCHLNEHGNAEISREIATSIRKYLVQR
tara:strand:- start:378 stop:1454 length:1077 start_codon:yes stop_codon:yes gene_type:complete